MQIVFITGKQGAGKSFAAKSLADEKLSLHIDVDRILAESAKAWQDRGGRTRYSWSLWQERSASDLRPDLRRAIQALHASLAGSERNIVIEGAILCNQWFLDPFIEVLLDVLRLNPTGQHYFYVNPTNDIILENIRKRGRPGEAEKFQSVDVIAQCHRNFDRVIAQDPRWVPCDSGQTAVDAIRRVFG